MTKRLYIAVAALAALAVALVVWAALDDSGDQSSDSAPSIVSVSELNDLASNADAPTYWAGERPGAKLEYETVGERRYVRYLTGDAEAGSPLPGYLTIATYPLADPADALRANAKRTNTRLQRAVGGATVWVNPDRPQSVYLAEPGSSCQVEVYDPLPKRALSVALSGDVVPVGSSTR